MSKDPPLYRLLNQDRDTVLADRVRLAGSSSARRIGLRRHVLVETVQGLALAPCEALHTFGMRFSIDVIFLDAKYHIRRVVESLKPNRIAVCFSAELAVELLPGRVRGSGSVTGDLLRFERVTDQRRTDPGQGLAYLTCSEEVRRELPIDLNLP